MTKSVKLKITSSANPKPNQYSHVISTLFAPVTSSLLSEPIPPLSSVEAVTVQVVNLYFTNPRLLPVQGFGYLIPKSVPEELNRENALGVIFDSQANNMTIDKVTKYIFASGTSLTVMFGGHYWNGRTEYPTDDEAVMNARKILGRHLGIFDPPAYTLVTLQKNCIPQYTVGHEDRMQFAHELLKIQFKGRLAVAGSSYDGVGLNDVAASGYLAARSLVGAGTPGGIDPEEWTGLQNIGKFVTKRI